jgi:hypothetical protein
MSFIGILWSLSRLDHAMLRRHSLCLVARCAGICD